MFFVQLFVWTFHIIAITFVMLINPNKFMRTN